MFRGQSLHKISDSGRVSIPSKFRDNLDVKYKTNVVIVSAFENSLICYPLPEWERLESKISELPQFKKDTVEFERYLIGSANECDIDSEGRIMIPNIFRKSLKITKTVVFVGMLARFEIWSEKSWSKVSKTGFKKFQKSREVIDAI